MFRCLVLLLSLCILSGCATAVPLLIRRGVVGNDWVYVKEEKKLYKRYIQKGMMLIGNTKLDNVGYINHSNEKIIIYPDYQTAKNSEQEMEVDEDSKKFIPEDKPVEEATE